MFKKQFINAISTKVYAHSIDEQNLNETLIEHSRKTYDVFYKIVDTLNIDSVLVNLLSNLYEDFALDKNFNKLVSKSYFIKFFWKVIEKIIFFHDLGKINPNFQHIRLQQDVNLHKFNIYSDEFFADSKHSKFSKFFINILLESKLEETKFFERYKNNHNAEDNLKVLYKLVYIGLILNSVVDRHHSKLKKIENLLDDLNDEYKQNLETIKSIESKIFIKVNEFDIIDFFNPAYFDEIKKELEENFNFFCLYKLLYSLLVVSDYYATYSFYSDISLEDIQMNFITENVLKELNKNFYTKREYNKKLKSEKIKKKIEDKKMDEISDINILRSKILIESSRNLKKALDKEQSKIFFLNVPTGGGKTNISMKLLLDILQHPNTKNLMRAHYIFPYVNIIEQNYRTIVETLTKSDDEEIISKIYSYNEWDFSKKKDEEMEYFINQQFLNYPVTIISNVNFFNSFIKNMKKSNYKILNFVNSVIILDEIQALPVNDWQYFSKLLKEISEKYNIYFILMSATLPDLSKFVENKTIFNNLIDFPSKYQTHKCFLRTFPIFETKETIRKDSYTYFIERISKERKKHLEKYIKILCVVNTVQNSYDLYTYLKDKLSHDFEIHLLNSTILTQRRQEIIHLLNKNSEDLNKNIVLVSTQSVEAGVDIDCHFGFREYSPLDSIEQISGRINREGNRTKENSKLFVFEMNTSNIVYCNDIRIKIQNQHKEKIREILAKKEFNYFYNLVIKFQKADDFDYDRIFNEFLKPTYDLDFEKLSQYDYIDGDNITFFIPIEIDIDRFCFTNAEIDYLKKRNINVSDHLDGGEVWDLFEQLVSNQDSNYKFLEIKKFQSILNKFTFSFHNRIRKDKVSLKNIISFHVESGEFREIGGLIKISKEKLDELNYRIESGLNPSNLNKL